jgi:hypothetical protein
VKAVTIKHFPNYYDFLEDEEFNPLLDNGKFEASDPIVEREIYDMAKDYTFKDPKQLVKLLRKEEMKRLHHNKRKPINK